MAITATYGNALQLLQFNNTNAANVGDSTGLRGSSTAGSLYIALHTADPGTSGDQTTNEIAYTNYARVAVARSGSGFTVSGLTVSNVGTVSFPTCGASGATATHFSIGTASSGAGVRMLNAALTASLIISNGITPQFTAGNLTDTVA